MFFSSTNKILPVLELEDVFTCAVTITSVTPVSPLLLFTLIQDGLDVISQDFLALIITISLSELVISLVFVNGIILTYPLSDELLLIASPFL